RAVRALLLHAHPPSFTTRAACRGVTHAHQAAAFIPMTYLSKVYTGKGLACIAGCRSYRGCARAARSRDDGRLATAYAAVATPLWSCIPCRTKCRAPFITPASRTSIERRSDACSLAGQRDG